MKICQAQKKHANDILRILTPHIKSGIILPRDKNDILNSIRNFIVAESENTTLGCLALKDYGSGLFEIRSLAVDEKHFNKGVGTALIKYAVETVSKNKIGKRIFALTLRPRVFQNIGFKLTEKESFPEKIMEDCSKCKMKSCDEVAVLYEL